MLSVIATDWSTGNYSDDDGKWEQASARHKFNEKPFSIYKAMNWVLRLNLLCKSLLIDDEKEEEENKMKYLHTATIRQ